MLFYKYTTLFFVCVTFSFLDCSSTCEKGYEKYYTITIPDSALQPDGYFFVNFSEDNTQCLLGPTKRVSETTYVYDVLNIQTRKMIRKEGKLNAFPMADQISNFLYLYALSTPYYRGIQYFWRNLSNSCPIGTHLSSECLTLYPENSKVTPAKYYLSPILPYHEIMYSVSPDQKYLVTAQAHTGDAVDIYKQSDSIFEYKNSITAPKGMLVNEIGFTNSKNVVMINFSNINRYKLFGKKRHIVILDIETSQELYHISDRDLRLQFINVSPDKQYIIMVKIINNKDLQIDVYKKIQAMEP